MISQEIFDYLLSSQSSEDGIFPKHIDLFIQKGLLIQIFEDGMTLIHKYEEKELLRVMMQHSDTINDLQLKEYSNVENTLSFFTCIFDQKLYEVESYERVRPVDGDLKRIVPIDEKDMFGGSFEEAAFNQLSKELGIKCMAYNHMRNQLAVGDMLGNIRFYQMSPDNHQYLHQVNFIEAHEGKVVALQYSEPFHVPGSDQYVQFLVSASSDRMIHIFNARDDDYELIQTIDVHKQFFLYSLYEFNIHTTSLIDAKFIKCTISQKNKHKITAYEKQLRLYTCSTDKSIFTHKYNPIDGKFATLAPKELQRNKIYKMCLTDQSIILAKDQGFIEVKSLDTGKQTQNFQQQSLIQSFSKSMLDYTNISISSDLQLIAMNDKEKTIQIRETRQCSILLSKFGLAEGVTSLQLTPDNQYLVCSSTNSKDQGGDSNQKIAFDPSSQIPQREFKVREELFNTWAKSTNQAQQSIVSQGDQQQNQSNFEDSLNNSKNLGQRRQTVDNQKNQSQNIIEQQKERHSSAFRKSKSQKDQEKISPSKIGRTPVSKQGSFIGGSIQQPDFNQQKVVEEQLRGIDDFIEELQNDDHNQAFLEGQQQQIIKDNQTDLSSDHSQDDSRIQVQDLSNEELERKILAKNSMLFSEMSKSTLNIRNSLTMKYLIETPRANNQLTCRNLSQNKEDLNEDGSSLMTDRLNLNQPPQKPKIMDFQSSVAQHKLRSGNGTRNGMTLGQNVKNSIVQMKKEGAIIDESQENTRVSYLELEEKIDKILRMVEDQNQKLIFQYQFLNFEAQNRVPIKIPQILDTSLVCFQYHILDNNIDIRIIYLLSHSLFFYSPNLNMFLFEHLTLSSFLFLIFKFFNSCFCRSQYFQLVTIELKILTIQYNNRKQTFFIFERIKKQKQQFIQIMAKFQSYYQKNQ